MTIRSNGMLLSVALGVLLWTHSAFGQTRPRPSEVFQSRVTVEITTATGVTKGVGKVVFDQTTGRAREYYRLQGGTRDETVTRYDLGAIIHNDPPTCDVTQVTGTMPRTWDWVQNAKMGNGETVDGIDITFWVFIGSADNPQPSGFAFGAGTLRIGTPNRDTDSDVPVILEIITPERTVRLHFLNWRTTFRPKPSLFKIPRNCPD